MKREFIITEDGSHSLYVPELNEHFHSTHGAVQEAMHVFIRNGLHEISKSEITIFEVGFGTGLNALLTLANIKTYKINYISIEKYPLAENEYLLLNYANEMNSDLQNMFRKMHSCDWNTPCEINSNFILHKIEVDFCNIDYSQLSTFDLIYFDAFAPNKQHEMWSELNFHKLAKHTNKGGRFVTYCAQGEVRRKLMRSGFEMFRIPGPPMKRQMLVGIAK